MGGIGSTHPVRQKLPNGYGLYDVHGNVGEWTHDLVETNSISSTMPAQTNYLGVTDPLEGMRSMKGGTFVDYPRVLRSAAYGQRTSTGQYQAIGVRLVRIAYPVQ
jgi:formylglycine-generating enzyme required for sulfatase activity